MTSESTSTERDRKAVVLMASFPPRKSGMLSSIKQLLPQCDDFCLWLNEYEKIPPELLEFDQSKLHITLSPVDLKDNGRYTFIERNKSAYVFVCDDDIDWPPDYVQHSIAKLNEHGCAKRILSYYQCRKCSKFCSELEEDAVIQLKNTRDPALRHLAPLCIAFGSGTMAFVPELVGWIPDMRELEQLYDQEVILGSFCIKNGIEVISPARRSEFVKWKTEDGRLMKDDSTALRFKNRDRIGRTLAYLDFKCMQRFGQFNDNM